MLDNLLNIKNPLELALKEEKISKKKAVKIYESNFLENKEAGKFSTLSVIHNFLFSDIYDFAGKIRKVDISKNGFRFASALYLKEALTKIDAMPQNNFDLIIEKYIEMNIAHPFREGNGRSTRIWLDHILEKELQKIIDWSEISAEDYMSAMQRSPVKDIELKSLFKNALSDNTKDKELYLRNIDTSYLYEGYSSFKAIDFANKD